MCGDVRLVKFFGNVRLMVDITHNLSKSICLHYIFDRLRSAVALV